MASASEPSYPTRGINAFVSACIRSLPDLTGRTVLDIPSGDGRATHEFRRKGATVHALDLFPEFMKAPGATAGYGDLSAPLPLPDASVDVVVCQEGIEHIPDQLSVFREFNRVLKPGGTLLLSTPNKSHLRSRLSHLLIETDYWKNMPPTELDSIWFAKSDTRTPYYGHLFLLTVQHLQSLLDFTGFTVERRIATNLSASSVIAGLPLWPVLALYTWLSYRSYRRKNPHVPQTQRDAVLWARAKLNLDHRTLFRKHICWVMRKHESVEEAAARLKAMQRGQ